MTDEPGGPPGVIPGAGDAAGASAAGAGAPSLAAGSTLNPWIDMWTRPRAAMRRILDTDPKRLVLLLAAIGGMSRALDRASFKSAGDHLPLGGVLVVCTVFGALTGVLMLYLFGFFIRRTGRWFGGRGEPAGIRAALAWPNVITVWVLALLIPELLLFGEELYTSETPRLDASPMLWAAFLGFALIEVVLGVWTVVVFLKCLGEAQGFSAWKALGNVLAAALLLFGPLVALVVLVALVFL